MIEIILIIIGFFSFTLMKHFKYRCFGILLKSEVVKKLKNAKNPNISEEEMSYLSGIPQRTLSRYLEGQYRPSIIICLSFVCGLNMTNKEAIEFLTRFGFTEEILSFDCYKELFSAIRNRDIKMSYSPYRYLKNLEKEIDKKFDKK